MAVLKNSLCRFVGIVPNSCPERGSGAGQCGGGEGKGTTGGVDIPQGEGTIGLQLQQ